MNRLFTTIIGASLIFTAAAMAQQEESTPDPKKQRRQEQRQQRQEATQGQQPQPQGARQKRQMQRANPPGATESNVPAQRDRGERRNRREQTSNASAGENANASTPAEPRRNRQRNQNAGKPAASSTTETTTERNKANAARATGEQRTAQGNRRSAKARKPDVQTVQRIKQQHSNFHAQAKPQNVPAVKFEQNYRITNAERWTGPQYVAFRDYRPVWHDRNWWHSRYPNIVLIGGGYYYWSNGYWYPAWGYDPGASYYVYNGPIYTGTVSRPPDQVIADVQAVLQDMGYYRGEVDGLLGPLTRDALTQYQADQGLYQTAAIDQPTLDSLGIAG